jgi:hypothetical protein
MDQSGGEMKQFLLFAGSTYYPLGGWIDFRGAFDTKEEAISEFAKNRWDWGQIVDLETGNMIEVIQKE